MGTSLASQHTNPEDLRQVLGDLNTIVDAYSEPLEAGLAAGLRFHITENLSVIPRYYHGITPVADSELRDETNQFLFFFEAYNRTMQLSVAWKMK